MAITNNLNDVGSFRSDHAYRLVQWEGTTVVRDGDRDNVTPFLQWSRIVSTAISYGLAANCSTKMAQYVRKRPNNTTGGRGSFLNRK